MAISLKLRTFPILGRLHSGYLHRSLFEPPWLLAPGRWIPKDTPRMHVVARFGPAAAKVGLRGPSVGPQAAVERAENPILEEVVAGGNHLHPERKGSYPLHLTEVRRLSRSDQ